MQPTRLLYGLLLCLTVQTASAQKLIRGTVTDAETDAPLPAATLYIEGTLRGTITNSDGVYELNINTLPATLVVRYIGYESQLIPVTAGTDNRLNVALQPVTYQLDQLVVTEDDPAINIMRKVIERKAEWWNALSTWKADAYNRFTAENDTGIVAITESVSEGFWDRERGLKEVAKGKRQTANLEFDELMPAAIFMQNLYDDDIELAGYEFIGVTHPKALQTYRFKLEGYRYRDDQLVYDISVTPRSKLQPAFIGHVAVLDEAYALLEVDLVPNESFLFPLPIQNFDIAYQQQFDNFGRDFWLPVDFQSRGSLNISFPGLKFPTIKFSQITRLTNYEVNTTLPDSLYAEDKMLFVDSVAVEAGTAFEELEPVPLSVREVEAYDTIDSTMTLQKAYKPRGFLARFIEEDYDDEDNSDSDGQRRRRSGRIPGLLLTPQLWFNRVDEGHVGLKVESDVSNRFDVYTEVGYATGTERWSYGGGAEVRWGPRRRGWVGGSYRDGTDTRYTSATYNMPAVSLITLLAGTDYFDYYRNERLRTEVGYRFRPLQTRIVAGYRNERHRALSKTSDYDLFGSDFVQRSNPAVEEGQLHSVTFQLNLGGDFEVVTGNRRLELLVEHALSGDFDFTRYQAVFDWRLETFLKRRLLPNALDIRMVAGTYSGRLPIQRFGILEPSVEGINIFGGFKALRKLPYEGERYAAVFWEHNFRTVPFELIGWRSVAEAGVTLSIYGAHGRTWIREARLAELGYAPVYQDQVHHEIGLSVSNLFGFPIRLDFTRRIDRPDFFFGIGISRVF